MFFKSSQLKCVVKLKISCRIEIAWISFTELGTWVSSIGTFKSNPTNQHLCTKKLQTMFNKTALGSKHKYTCMLEIIILGKLTLKLFLIRLCTCIIEVQFFVFLHKLTYVIVFFAYSCMIFKGSQQALFLRHEGYLGAIGAFLKGVEQDGMFKPFTVGRLVHFFWFLWQDYYSHITILYCSIFVLNTLLTVTNSVSFCNSLYRA